MKPALKRFPAPRPLARGWHPLTREAVSASQRERILDAMAQAVAEKGCAATSVADVVALAGVSRRTFYELFKDKDDCFLAAYRAGMELLLDGIRKAVAPLPKDDWRQRAEVSLKAYLEVLASKPAAAWAYSVEVFGAGAKALGYRAGILKRWVEQWRALQRLAQAEDSSIRLADDHRLLALVGGIEELVRECLRTRGAKHLPQLAKPATQLALSALMGPRAE